MTTETASKRGKLLRYSRGLGRGIIVDIKTRLPYYLADWRDAWNYRVIPSTIYIYFTNLLPAIAFAQDMFDRTDNSFGVNEVLLSSAIAGITFGLFSGQPLCIVGVTGPIAIFNSTVYEIVHPKGIPYFQFMCWICLWSMVMHFAIAVLNWVNALRLVTRFSCDIFGFFICVIYIQKGIQILTRQFNHGDADQGYLSVVVALLAMIFGVCAVLLGKSRFFGGTLRKVIADYGTPLSVVLFTGFVHFGGRLSATKLQTLPITKSFAPTETVTRSGWFIHFWEGISVGDVFLALPFAFLLTILFYFDHNVSSLICQGSEFPLKKPSSFHWDFFLLGITTGVAGLLGIPAPNGLIPQAPLHTQSLCVVKTKGEGTKAEQYVDSVVEQRFTNTMQGLMILGTMTRPLLVVLGLVPQGVLSGLFWIMGISGLLGNGITTKLKFLFSDSRYRDPQDMLQKVSIKNLWLFTIIALIGAGAEIGITQTVAAVGFPAVLMGFGVVGYFLPSLFPKEDIKILDEPTASDFILQNLKSSDEPSVADVSGSSVDANLPLHELSSDQPRLRRRMSHAS